MRLERSDAGFTLLELLMAIAITAVITPSVAAVLMVSLRTTDQSQDRVLGSRDAQVSAMWFTRDVQSASTVVLSATGCPVPAGAAHLVSFDTADGTVAYYTTGTSGQGELQRRHCPTAGPPTDRVLASSLTLPVAAPVCAPAPCEPDSRSVRLDLNSRAFDFELTGTRRATA